MTSSNLVDCMHRQVRRLLALEDAADIDADLTIRIRNVGTVAHQPAGFGIFTRRYAAGIARRPAGGQFERAGCKG